MTAGRAAIREARADELDQVVALWNAGGAVPSLTDTPRALAPLLERPDSWLLVAVVEGELVGSLIAAWDGWRGSFSKLAVIPEERRNGIAAALVAEGERLLTEVAGAVRISAIVLAESEAANGFWSAAGYELHAEARRYTRAFASSSPSSQRPSS